MHTPLDLTRYLVMPRTTGRHYLSLGRLLLKTLPTDPSADVILTHNELKAELERIMRAYVARHREYGPSIVREEMNLDTFVDALLYIVRDRCDHWQLFTRPAPSQFADQPPDPVPDPSPEPFDYAAALALAKRAQRISALLFAEGLDYTRLNYTVQAEHMLVLDKLITDEQLAPELDVLVGPWFMGALRDGQQKYLAMVDRRVARGRGSAVNLHALNADLQVAIQAYVIAVLAMHRPKDAQNVEMIRKALQPIDALREQIQRDRRKVQGLEVDEIDEAAEAELEELAEEQQALDAELGLLTGSGEEQVVEGA